MVKRTDVLKFAKNNIYNISEITRTNKLAEIIDLYSDKPSDEIYVVQNTRNKKGRAVIADLEYFEELLRYKEFVDEVIDEVMDEIAFERKDDEANIPLAEVIARFDLDVERIERLVYEVEEDED